MEDPYKQLVARLMAIGSLVRRRACLQHDLATGAPRRSPSPGASHPSDALPPPLSDPAPQRAQREPEVDVEEVARLLRRELSQKDSGEVADLVLLCASQLSTKTPHFAALVALLEQEHPEFVAQLLSRVCADDERSEVLVVEDGRVRKYAGDFEDYRQELIREINAELDED